MKFNTRSALTGLLGLSLLAACGQTPAGGTLGAQGGAGKPATGSATAQARVFMPNPIQSTGVQTLQDDKDSAAAVPAAAYHSVTLTDLDGSGYLSGRWAKVINETGAPVYGTGPFNFTRDQDGFEQVMAYYWVTEAQKYLQTLGFGSELAPVKKSQMLVKVSQQGVDNSYLWDKHNWLRLGKGGVDDAEDGEVILHEYGHAIHADQVAGFGASIEAGAIGEGFGDYFAMTVGSAMAGRLGVPTLAPLGCIMDWDATSYTTSEPHCLRRIDTELKYADRKGQVHFDGQIWSRALWDIWNALGRETADRIIINAQFRFAPDTTFAAAAQHTVDTAQAMYGAGAAATVKAAFVDRGILQ